MAYKIIWSPEAVKTFDRIVEYISINFTNKEVAVFINTVNRKLLIMAEFPRTSRTITLASRRRKAVIHKRTVLFYSIRERRKEIELLSFVDTRQNNRWLKKN
ncbi:type II toxin-antitoxin system RelE/ParE family toxin [Terrimonas pollutisoli]|uniref:type II toxin-antitoxin system RelE/ParE family toxin n=1 Tax=Terrimonas pollutisoli TaxID=3034147 RepID=UPI0023EA8477|nr:type II toxin-antitoxin system RelE/ParE family toxin [Terrimonas sp. H1YJ31]